MTRGREFQKNSKKIQKIKKHHSHFISSQAGSGQAEKEVKNNFVPSSIPTRPGLEYSQTNSKKIKKHHSKFISSQTRLG